MRIWTAVILMLMITIGAQAQYASPSVDFFLHDKFYDFFLRDHYRFETPNLLRIEYWNVRWLDSDEDTSEYGDYLHLEGVFPIYAGKKMKINIPFHYRHVPIWAESKDATFGASVNVLEPYLISYLTLTERLKAIVGWEYNLKGDNEYFGAAVGRKICLLKAFFSYDLHPQLNLVAGARLDRYYYDTDEEPDFFKLANRLYYHPGVMLNWHPNDKFIFMLGLPGSGVHLEFGDVLKAEARVSIDGKTQIAVCANPTDRITTTLRFLNTPYVEMPVKIPGEDSLLVEMLSYTDKSILLETGWKLNPAAMASLGFRYSPGGDVKIKDRANENVIRELDGKPSFAIGATFTMSLEALLGIQ